MVPSRVESDAPGGYLAPLPAASTIAALVPDDEFETPPLPREHRKWVKDGLLVSQRAKLLLERIKPVVVRVLGFWDLSVRSVVVTGVRVAVDSSGSYKIDENF